MKIAIIGSGISGLTAAFHLHAQHDVTVFEAGAYIGGHTNTVKVQHGGKNWNIDTGFIVFNETNYPHFTSLLRQLNVPTQPTAMSFSVRHDSSRMEYCTASANRFFAQRTNLLRPSFHRLWLDILRFNREAARLEGVEGDKTTVSDYVRAQRYSTQFLEHYLVPLGASLWSCPPGTFRAFPIRFVVDFMTNHCMLQFRGQPQWRVVSGGSARYVDALIGEFRHKIRLNCGISQLRRVPGGVHLRDSDGAEGRFDQVIVACHADQALRLLEHPLPIERELLGAFPYQPNDAILHTDPAVLPRDRKVWASWNYHIPASDPAAVHVTYNMNILQGLSAPVPFNVTLNDTDGVPPEHILGRFRYEHPIFTANRAAAQARHHELIGLGGLSYCGAYWGYGFHEDGVRSALALCQVLQQRVAA